MYGNQSLLSVWDILVLATVILAKWYIYRYSYIYIILPNMYSSYFSEGAV